MARDFTEARRKARAAADKTADDKLDAIAGQAAQFEAVFDSLKLTDQATYDRLVAIVEDASARNESLASVVDRVKALGTAGAELATRIAGIAGGGGGLTAVRTALGLLGRG